MTKMTNAPGGNPGHPTTATTILNDQENLTAETNSRATLPTLVVAQADRVASSTWARRSYTREEFRDRFRAENVPERPDKDGPAYVGGALTKRSSPRRKDTIRERWVVTLDADHVAREAVEPLIESVRALGAEAIVHTTFSHTPAEPRLRVVLPLAAAVPADHFKALADSLMDELATDGVEWDRSCDEPERAMYWPAKNTAHPEDYRAEFIDGAPLDREAWAAKRPAAFRQVAPSRERGGLKQSAFTLPSPDGAFNRWADEREDEVLSVIGYTRDGERWRWKGASPTTPAALRRYDDDGHYISDHASTDDAAGLRGLTMFGLYAVHKHGRPTADELENGSGEGSWGCVSAARTSVYDDFPEFMDAALAASEFTALSEQIPTAGAARAHSEARAHDLGMAEELAPLLGMGLRHSPALGWLRYNGGTGLWEPATDSAAALEVMGKARELSGVAYDRGDDARGKLYLRWADMSRAKKLVEALEALLAVDDRDIDAHPDHLPVANGVVHLSAQGGPVLLPHDPKWLFTKAAPVAWEERATDAKWDAVVGIFEEDTRDWIQAFAGVMTTGHTGGQDLFMVIMSGVGSGGKTTFMSGLRSVLGDALAVFPGRKLLTSAADKAEQERLLLRGARAALIEELPDGRRLDSGALKDLVNTPTMTGRALYRPPVTFTATHTTLAASNFLPLPNEMDSGTLRRVMIVPVSHAYKAHPDASRGERPAIPGIEESVRRDDSVRRAALAWLVEGARRWYAEGRRMPEVPESVREATDEWTSQADIVRGFHEDMLIDDPNSIIPMVSFGEAVRDYLREQGAAPWRTATIIDRFGSHPSFRAALFGTVKRGKATLSLRPLLDDPEDMPSGSTLKGVKGVRYRTTLDDDIDSLL